MRICRVVPGMCQDSNANANADLMLRQGGIQWTNIKLALVQCWPMFFYLLGSHWAHGVFAKLNQRQ